MTTPTPTRPVRGATDLDLVRAALEDDYDVVAEIGRGGMAVVYEARERTLDRAVAIKVLPFSLAHDDALVERFQREARTAAQLEHPHIVPIYRVGRSDQVIYFVMKLLRGRSLSDYLLERGTLSPAETRRVLTETAGALGCAHRRGVVHRDVKPDNILLDDDGRCMVTDFGIARSGADSTLTAAGTSMGTPRYMSPEQARAKPVDGRSDIYSLGVVGYQCLTGRLPFDGDDMMAILLAHVSTPVPPPAAMTPEQRLVYDVVERMLAKLPEQRPGTAEEVTAALAAAASTPARAGGTAPDATHPLSNAPRYGTLAPPPATVPALDRTLEAGYEMLRQQRPRVDAGLAAGRRAIERQAPRVRSLAARAAAVLGAGVVRARALAQADPRRAWLVLGGAAFLGIGMPVGAHFAIAHRSRCPAVPAEPASTGTGGASEAGKPRAFTVLLDGAEPVRRNGDVEVYYDVCGLEAGTGFTARVTVARQWSGLRKLLGGSAAPVTEVFEETARGPAVRRHRSVDLDGKPAGAYSLSVVVTDAQGRRRAKSTTFTVRGAEGE